MSHYTDTTPESPHIAVAPRSPGEVTHARVIEILVAKGYLPKEYPLPESLFDPALLAALDAAPPAPPKESP